MRNDVRQYRNVILLCADIIIRLVWPIWHACACIHTCIQGTGVQGQTNMCELVSVMPAAEEQWDRAHTNVTEREVTIRVHVI